MVATTFKDNVFIIMDAQVHYKDFAVVCPPYDEKIFHTRILKHPRPSWISGVVAQWGS